MYEDHLLITSYSLSNMENIENITNVETGIFTGIHNIFEIG